MSDAEATETNAAPETVKHEYFSPERLKERRGLVERVKVRSGKGKVEPKNAPAPAAEKPAEKPAPERDDAGKFVAAEAAKAEPDPAAAPETPETPVEPEPKPESEEKETKSRAEARSARLLAMIEDDPETAKALKQALEAPKSVLDTLIRARRDEQKANRQLKSASAKEQQLEQRDQAIAARERAANELGSLEEIRELKEIAALRKSDPFLAAKRMGLSFRELAEYANRLGEDGKPKPPDPSEERLSEIERRLAEREAAFEKKLAEREEAERKAREDADRRAAEADRERHELGFIGRVIDETIEDFPYVDAEPDYADRAKLAAEIRGAIYYHFEQTGGEELSPRQILQRLDRALEQRETQRQQRLSAKRRDAPPGGAERGNGAVKPAKPVGSESPSSLSTADASQKTGEVPMSRKERRAQALKRFAGG